MKNYTANSNNLCYYGNIKIKTYVQMHCTFYVSLVQIQNKHNL